MKKGEIYEGRVQEVLFPDKAVVVTDEGETAQVKYGIPGQRIRFRVKKKRKEKIEGVLLEVLEKSPDETVCDCKWAGRCGGCLYQTLPYEKQLAIKRAQIKGMLDKGGTDYEFEGIVASPVVCGYRNKVELTFGDSYMGGPLALGMHQRGSFYDIAGIETCQIMTADMRMAATAVLAHFSELNIPFYHRMRHEGVLRHLLLRSSAATGELLVAIVTSSQGDASAMQLATLTEKLKNLPWAGTLAGVLHITNDSLADVVQSDRTEILYGKDWITEKLLGLSFRVTLFSFFQTNSRGAELLYQTVRDYIGETNEKVIFDLYSGTGTIAQILAPVAKHVTGVEIVEEAVEAARVNAELNGLNNCSFLAGDVLKVIDDLTEKPDLIVLDPPRDGIHPKALPKIIAFDVPTIVYVSCKPTSLVRDREILEAAGYHMVKARAVDMFPATGGIETVALLHKVL